MSTGLTGVVMHDGPLKKPSGAPEDLGSMFWNIFARSGPSADNCQATSLFMINDDGIWLLRRLRGKAAAQVMRFTTALLERLDRGKLAIRGQSGQGEDPEWAYRLPS